MSLSLEGPSVLLQSQSRLRFVGSINEPSDVRVTNIERPPASDQAPRDGVADVSEDGCKAPKALVDTVTTTSLASGTMKRSGDRARKFASAGTALLMLGRALGQAGLDRAASQGRDRRVGG
mgnify:CR=1 FL=1